MFKRLLLALALSLSASSAFAVCGAIPLPILDGGGVSRNISSATAADGNCKTYIDADTGSQLHTDITAPIVAGTNIIGKVGIDQTTPGTTNGVQVNAALPAGTNVVGFISNDPCTQLTKTNFTIATSAGTVQLVAPSGSTQVYICSLFTIGATASIQNIVGGTGATCTTGTPVAIAGSTTAANGMSFAANGGFTFGNGGATVLRTTTAGHGVCLIQSATAAIAGGGTFVQQ